MSLTSHHSYLIVGGGVAGWRAAETLRISAPDASVALLAGEAVPLYSKPRLPLMLRGEIADEGVSLQISEDVAQKVAVRLSCRACGFDADAHIVETADGARWSYDKLIVATGARARKLRVPGEALRGIHRLRSLDDARGLDADITKAEGRGRAIVIGDGLVALDLCSILHARGFQVTNLVLGPVWGGLSLPPNVGAAVASRLQANGVELHYNKIVQAFEGTERVGAVHTADGSVYPADLATVAIGIEPETEWLGAELALHRGQVACDRQYRASAADVYAAGDVAHIPGVAGGTWASASAQGHEAARALLGLAPEEAPENAYTTAIFGMPICVTGNVRPIADSEFVVEDHHDGAITVWHHLDSRIVGGVVFAAEKGPGFARRRVMLAKASRSDFKLLEDL